MSACVRLVPPSPEPGVERDPDDQEDDAPGGVDPLGRRERSGHRTGLCFVGSRRRAHAGLHRVNSCILGCSPSCPADVMGYDGVEGHYVGQHTQGEEEPVINQLVITCLGQVLKLRGGGKKSTALRSSRESFLLFQRLEIQRLSSYILVEYVGDEFCFVVL